MCSLVCSIREGGEVGGDGWEVMGEGGEGWEVMGEGGEGWEVRVERVGR